jgi:hypothetical protein
VSAIAIGVFHTATTIGQMETILPACPDHGLQCVVGVSCGDGLCKHLWSLAVSMTEQSLLYHHLMLLNREQGSAAGHLWVVNLSIAVVCAC